MTWEEVIIVSMYVITISAILAGLWMGAPGQRFRKWRDPEGYQSDYFDQSDSPPSHPMGADSAGTKVVVKEGEVLICSDDVGSPSGLEDCDLESVKQGAESILSFFGGDFDWLGVLLLFEHLVI